MRVSIGARVATRDRSFVRAIWAHRQLRKAPDRPALPPMTALPLVPAQIDAKSSHR
jgi:hypothetical protein